MMPEDGLDSKLDALFAEYRGSCPEPEPSAGFTPGLWRKIDARRNYSFRLSQMARRFATAAAAISTVLLLLLLAPVMQNSVISTGTYVEALSDEHEIMAFADIVHPELPADSALQ